MRFLKKNNPLAAALFLSAALFSCGEKTSGCLDPEAQNFAVEVDKDCDSCCRYPVLQLNIAPIWGDETVKFSYSKTWEDATGHPFKIDTIAFYLSDFQLFSSATGNSVIIRDSLRLRALPDSAGAWFRRDVALLRPTTEVHNIGSLLAKGSFDQLRFKVGLRADWDRVVPTLAPSGHPLRLQPEGLYDAAGHSFSFMKIWVRKDTLVGTPRSEIEWPSSLGAVEVALPFSKETGWKRGIAPTFRLVMDYAKLFEGVDITAADADIVQKIRANVAGSFTLKSP